MRRFLNWKFLLSFVLCASLLTLGGCAAARGVLDFVLGVEYEKQVDDPATPDIDESTLPPVPKPAEGGGLLDWLGKALGVLFPWGAGASGIAGALRWAYIESRKRNLDDMFKAVVIGIKNAVDAAGDGKLDKEALYASIQGAREIFASRDLFDKVVDEIKKAHDLAIANGDAKAVATLPTPLEGPSGQ